MTATCVTSGLIALSSSSHFPPTPYSNCKKPVALPPGRDRLATKPEGCLEKQERQRWWPENHFPSRNFSGFDYSQPSRSRTRAVNKARFPFA